MILKDKVIENNILNCTIEINNEKIQIKNFDMSKDFIKTKKYYIYIRKIDKDIHFDVKPIISVFFSLFNMYNIRKCLENSEYIKVVESEKDAQILFTKPTLTYDYVKKKNQWQNYNKDIRNICHKKNLNELVKDTNFSIKTEYIENGKIPESVKLWNKDQLLICKPQNDSCGRGIHVKPYTDMMKFIKKNKLDKYLLQEYIESKLINEKKFDLRLYVFIDDKGDYFLSEHGFLRFAQKKYNPNKNDRSIHLTNTSVAGKNAEIIPFNTWDEKHKYLHSIHQVIGETVKRFYKSQSSKNFFQLLGCDIMIDSNDTIRLIEINKKPSTKYINDISKEIKQNMVKDFIDFLQSKIVNPIVHLIQ